MKWFKRFWPRDAKKYWMTFEWYGLSFYLNHCFRLTKELAGRDLSHLRFFIALPSYAIALWLWSPSIEFDQQGFEYIRPLLTEDTLGMLFFLHGIGTHWRLYAITRGLFWSALFGAIGMLLFFGYPVFIWFAIHRITGQGICMVGWGVVSTFITARVGVGEDRSGS